jgi:hypothetical protein
MQFSEFVLGFKCPSERRVLEYPHFQFCGHTARRKSILTAASVVRPLSRLKANDCSEPALYANRLFPPC